MNRKVMVTMMLAVTLMIPLAGCASKGKLSAAKLCASAGGTYSAQAHECNQPANAHRKASEMCMANGGYYDPNADTCEMGLE